jgi:hypothetical protein
MESSPIKSNRKTFNTKNNLTTYNNERKRRINKQHKCYSVKL